MFLYLIRHAEPDYAARVPYHRPPGPELTERGQSQAAALVPLMGGTGVQRVVSSPLRRCIMTGTPVAAALQVPLVIDVDLQEGQPDEAPNDITARMLRAVLAQVDLEVVALVSHGAPLTQLLRALTHDEVQLPPKDWRGNHLAEASVWGVFHAGGRWKARHLPPGGIEA